MPGAPHVLRNVPPGLGESAPSATAPGFDPDPPDSRHDPASWPRGHDAPDRGRGDTEAAVDATGDRRHRPLKSKHTGNQKNNPGNGPAHESESAQATDSVRIRAGKPTSNAKTCRKTTGRKTKRRRTRMVHLASDTQSTANAQTARKILGKRTETIRRVTDKDGAVKIIRCLTARTNTRTSQKFTNSTKTHWNLQKNTESDSDFDSKNHKISRDLADSGHNIHNVCAKFTNLQFDLDEFTRLSNLYGPFTYEALASPSTSLVPTYSPTLEDLRKQDLKGHIMWVQVPEEHALSIIQYIEQYRARYPFDIRAIIVLPRRTDSTGKVLQSITKKYKRVHTYPPGTYLFNRVDLSTGQNENTSNRITIVPYDVFLLDHTAEDRILTATAASESHHLNILQKTSENPKYPQNPHRKPKKNPKNEPTQKTIKSHQPRMELPLCSITNTSLSDGLLIFGGTLDQSPKNTTTYDAKVMVDSGASRDFISRSYVKKHNLAQESLAQKLRVALADGRQVVVGNGVTLTLAMGTTKITKQFVVTELTEDFDIILGMPFLRTYNPQINWQNGTITMPSANEILNTILRPRQPDVQVLHANAMARLVKKSSKNDTVKFFLAHLNEIEPTKAHLHQISTNQPEKEELTILQKIKTTSTQQDAQTTQRIHEILTKHQVLLEPLTDLPPARPGFDHTIDLLPEAQVPPGRVYRMSTLELEELKKQLKEYLSKNWIRTSTSMYAAPVLFARKANGTLRLCVDYRALNKYTKRVEFPLPNIDTILDTLGGSQIFTALDLAQGYHQIRVEEKDVHKTAFKTQFGLFEFTVLPFGLTAAPSTFQRLMNHVIRPHEKGYVICYLDDILIHSKSVDAHLHHLDEILHILSENNLKLRLEKCDFAMNALDYLGHTISGQGIQPSESKIRAVNDWPIPKNVKDVQSFLGFCNFYRRYMKNYSKTACPLYHLTKKGVDFQWDKACHDAFVQLKTTLTTAPVLATPRTGPKEEFILSTDASTFGIGAVLLQKQKDNSIRPVSYYAKSLNNAQRRYPIYDLELLAMASAVQEYRHYLEGCKKVTVLTDHATLRYLPTQGNLGRRHTTFVTALSPYFGYMDILYRKGSLNDSDPLSRRPDLVELNEHHLDSQPDTKHAIELYDASQFEKELEALQHHLNGLYELQFDKEILQKIRNGYTTDPRYNGNTLPVGVELNESNGLYYKADKICVPNINNLQELLINEYHDQVGHPDVTRTTANLLKTFWWFGGVEKKIKSHVKKCKICQRIKPRTSNLNPPLSPMPTPTRPWEHMSMDFITNLPNVDGYDAIATFVDMFTKQAHFAPCSSSITATQLAQLFIDNVYVQAPWYSTCFCRG